MFSKDNEKIHNNFHANFYSPNMFRSTSSVWKVWYTTTNYFLKYATCVEWRNKEERNDDIRLAEKIKKRRYLNRDDHQVISCVLEFINFKSFQVI